MSLTAAPPTDSRALRSRLSDAGLDAYALDLDVNGFTILPPELGLPGRQLEQLRDAVVAVAQRRSGQRPDLEGGLSHANLKSPFGEHLRFLLHEGELFEELLRHEAVDLLMQWLLGESYVLSSFTSMIKGPGDKDLGLHTDSQFIPSPLPPYAQVANATFLLSDYDRDSGSLCFVPGSHRWCRHPDRVEEPVSGGPHEVVAVEAPAGSLVVWHGSTWHGAFARTTPGLRMNLVLLFSRMYLRPREDYRDHLGAPAVERLSDLALRIGRDVPLGWRDDSEQARLGQVMRGLLHVGSTPDA